MKEKNIRTISRCNSMIYRMSNAYFDKCLQGYHIGCGQQFFLFHISRNEGITFQELAVSGHYDKGTVTRAVKKLEEEGYVLLKSDEADKRVKHIYTTRQARDVIAISRESVENLVHAMTEDFTKEDIVQACVLMERMAQNASIFTKKIRQEESGKNEDKHM